MGKACKLDKGKVVLGFLFLTQDRRQEEQDVCTWTLAGCHLYRGTLPKLQEKS